MVRAWVDKLRLLARGEDGFAVMATLAGFMFMFLVVVGVYAVGTAVKERIRLQNACDAAAYSASVVQADTLSRIATVNRAMSWTYVQMTRRQMDYIVYRWLDHTLDHFNADKTAALLHYLSSTPPPPCPIHASWGMDDKPFAAGAKIDLNGTHRETPSRISSAQNTFSGSHLSAQRASFYSASASIGGLEQQIKDDKATIREMNEKTKALADKLPDRVEKSVEEILKANVPDDQRRRCRWALWQNENPTDGAESVAASGDGYLRYLRNNGTDETHFLTWAGYSGGPSSVFETGIDTWFTRSNEMMPLPSVSGFQRSYMRYPLNTGALYSEWTWWSTKSVGCTLTPDGWIHGSYVCLTTCPHLGLEDRCRHSMTKPYLAHVKKVMKARFHGNMSCVWNNQYVGEPTKPLVLRKEFFGEKGAISVGLACRNRNPWFSVLGEVVQGVFTAFNPFSEWTWCFASARAGYKFLGEDSAGRDYRMDWKAGAWTSRNQSWNLCQSDWDGALIPVRRAKSQAAEGRWTSGDMDFLADWTGGDWRWLESGDNPDLGTWANMLAGGSGDMQDAPVQSWAELQPNAAANHAWEVRRKWYIGQPNQRLRWNALTDVMFH